MLRELGWITVVRGNRHSPKNSDCRLSDTSQLLAMERNLVRLAKEDAASFILQVFHTEDRVWIERCSSIIQEEVYDPERRG